MLRRVDVLLFIVFGTGINYLTILQLDNSFFLYGVGQFVLEFLYTLTLIFSIIKVFRDKRQVSILKKFKPLLLGVGILITFPSFSYLTDLDRGKNTILRASAGGDLTYVQLELRDDSSFKLYNSGPFGGQYYRGQYKFQNDTLIIDNGDTNLYPTLSFVTILDTLNDQKYLYPISLDAIRESSYKLRIWTENDVKDSR